MCELSYFSAETTFIAKKRKKKWGEMIAHFLFRLFLRYIARLEPKRAATNVKPLIPVVVPVPVTNTVVPDIIVEKIVVGKSVVVVVGSEILWRFNHV